MKGKQTLLSYHHSPQRSWSDAKQTKMTHSPSSPYQNVSLKKQAKTTQSAISQAELQLELNFYKAKCHELEQHSSRGSQNTTIQIQTAQIKELQKENADLKRQLQANKDEYFTYNNVIMDNVHCPIYVLYDSPFARVDTWRPLELYIGAIFLLPIRLVVLYSTFFIGAWTLKLFAIGLRRQDPYTKFRGWLITTTCRVVSRMCLYCYGFLWIDGKVSYEKDSIIVSNHVSLFDSFVHIYLYAPSFLAKASVDKDLVSGPFARILKCIYVDRETESNRNQALHDIQSRVESINKGLRYPPILIFPEGTTTNGRYLLKFKKGAFESMQPVKLVGIKYPLRNFDVYDNLGIKGIILSMCQFYNTVVVKEIPHFKAGRDWEEFAESARSKIATMIDAELSESGFREMKEYYGIK